MAGDVNNVVSCRAVLLFALRREADPLVWSHGLNPVWLDEQQTFAFVLTLPDPSDVIDPTPDDVIFDYSGVGRDATRRKLEQIFTHFSRPAMVIAAGFCGALRDRAAIGDVVAPAEVIDETGRRWACQTIPSLNQSGRLLTASRIIGDPVAKREVGQHFEADVVDMETAAIAEVCEARGVPFAAVRAVSDTADTALSPRLADLLSGGRVSPWQAVGAVLRQPSLLGEFRRLARDTRLAARNLADVLCKIVGGPTVREGAPRPP